MVVLITKGNWEFTGIGILEVLWKTLSGVNNWWIGPAVQFQNDLHGLWEGRGTGTASLEAKFLQHPIAMR